MSSIPEDVYLEILLKVPAKSTYICKCVCKSWSEIISNPSFANMHLDFNTQRRNYSLMFDGYAARKGCWTLGSINYDSLWSMDGSESEIVEMPDYPITEMCPKSSTCGIRRLLGSCNGLVCIYWYGSTGSEKSICFCNPTTKEYKITKSESVPGYGSIYISAFGYDSKVGDYKLIFLSGYTELIVYMLGSNTWKTSHPVPYRFHDTPQTGILVNGAFHWLGRASSKLIIVVFDLSDEKFEEFHLPKELLEKKHSSMTVGVLEGCLCVVVIVSEVCFEVWAMQDYGVQESWTPRYMFDYPRHFMDDIDASLKLMPSFKNGHILVRTSYDLFIYDTKHPRGRKPKSLSGLAIRNSVVYVESLVSLNSGTYAGRNKAPCT